MLFLVWGQKGCLIQWSEESDTLFDPFQKYTLKASQRLFLVRDGLYRRAKWKIPTFVLPKFNVFVCSPFLVAVAGGQCVDSYADKLTG